MTNKVKIILILFVLGFLSFCYLRSLKDEAEKIVEQQKTQTLKTKLRFLETMEVDMSVRGEERKIPSIMSADEILDEQSRKIAEDMKDYEYPKGKFFVNASNLADLTPENGGQPMRSVVVATCRGGSSFFGDILNAVPGTFYDFEPLKAIQHKLKNDNEIGLKYLTNLLRCNFSYMKQHLKLYNTLLYNRNTDLWSYLKKFPNLQSDVQFFESYCKLFPSRAMKVIRLRLKAAATLLQDSR